MIAPSLLQGLQIYKRTIKTLVKARDGMIMEAVYQVQPVKHRHKHKHRDGMFSANMLSGVLIL
jgi:hypothetical protein